MLHSQSIPCEIYEARDRSYNQGGAIMLSPNALRILDALGVYERIRPQGYSFEALTFKDSAGETKGQYYFGDEQRYGYKALRVYRHLILDEMSKMVEHANIPVHYNAAFASVLAEADEVTFRFANGSIKSAALLIGADGIHSMVRQYISPTAIPKYGGYLGITSAIETAKLRLPEGVDFQLPVAISGKPGSLVIAPQDPDAKEALIGTQIAYPEQDRVGWEALRADPSGMLRLLRKDMKDWPDVVQSALENAMEEKVNTWPFYTVPLLENWASPGRRVIVLGDAAHAIPPTTGQGVNQAFEDIYSLGLLLPKLSTEITLGLALDFWQELRQERVDKILDLTQKMNNKRLPAAEQEKLAKDAIWGESGDPREELRWLYQPDFNGTVSTWISKQNGTRGDI